MVDFQKESTYRPVMLHGGRMVGMNGYSVEFAEIVPVTFIKNSMNTNFALRDVLKLSD